MPPDPSHFLPTSTLHRLLKPAHAACYGLSTDPRLEASKLLSSKPSCRPPTAPNSPPRALPLPWGVLELRGLSPAEVAMLSTSLLGVPKASESDMRDECWELDLGKAPADSVWGPMS